MFCASDSRKPLRTFRSDAPRPSLLPTGLADAQTHSFGAPTCLSVGAVRWDKPRFSYNVRGLKRVTNRASGHKLKNLRRFFSSIGVMESPRPEIECFLRTVIDRPAGHDRGPELLVYAFES